MIRDIRGLIEAEKFPLTPVIQGSLFEMLSNELWLKVQSTNINFKEVGRLVQAEEFFEFSLDHHHIFERYIETQMQALIISSALKREDRAFEFGKALLKADPGYEALDYRPFSGSRSLSEESLIDFYLDNVHDDVVDKVRREKLKEEERMMNCNAGWPHTV